MRLIKGIKAGRSRSSVFHLVIVDDSFMFCDVSMAQCQELE